jgi:preprotein translocase subunit YajC
VFLAAESQAGGGGYFTLLMLLLLFGVMYFLLIRPNKRRRQQVQEMQASIGVGDEVLTIGGLYGYVTDIDDDRVVIEVSPGVTNVYSRGAISQIVTSAAGSDEPETDEDSPTDGEPPTASDQPSLKKIVDAD